MVKTPSPKSKKTQTPEKKTLNAKFTVNLRQIEDIDTVAVVKSNVDELLKWYNARMKNDYIKTFSSGLKVTHVKDNVFQISGSIDTSMLEVEALMDPDDDGNHAVQLGATWTYGGGMKSEGIYEFLVSGRPVRKSASSTKKTSPGKMTKINKRFIVSLRETVEVDNVKLVKSNVDKIVRWYTDRMKNDYIKTFSSGLKVSHVANDVFQIKGTINPTMLEVDALVDPDDDANYEIELDSSYHYLVSGHLKK